MKKKLWLLTCLTLLGTASLVNFLLQTKVTYLLQMCLFIHLIFQFVVLLQEKDFSFDKRHYWICVFLSVTGVIFWFLFSWENALVLSIFGILTLVKMIVFKM
jgi:hypothetical protein